MIRRVMATLAAVGFAVALLVAPAASGSSPALANGEVVHNSGSSQVGINVKIISSTGRVSYIGVLPGGSVTGTPRLDSWELRTGRCASFNVNGKNYYDQGPTWVWIPPGASVHVYVFRC